MLNNSTILVTGGAGFGEFLSHSLVSIEKAKNILNFNPMVSFKKGLERTVEFF